MECAVREVKEEAGVHIELGEKLPEVKTAYKDEEKTVVSWLGKCIGSDTPRHNDPDSEVADARWFDVAALPEIHVYQRPLIASGVDAIFKRLDEDHDNLMKAAGRRAIQEAREEPAAERIKRR